MACYMVYFIDGSCEGLVQLECHTIQSSATLRPRTRSTKFTLSLGGLYVKDLYNTSTQFPLLISPRQMVSTYYALRLDQFTCIEKIRAKPQYVSYHTHKKIHQH